MQMKIERLDYLGVVAGILKELELSKEIDALLPHTAPLCQALLDRVTVVNATLTLKTT